MNSLSSVRPLVSVRSLGIEIETVISYDRPVRAGYFYGFFYASTDGSIEAYPHRGIEFVSQPLPKNWLIKEINRLYKKVGPWEWNATCGIHVHVNRGWLSKDKAKLIHQFYCSLTEEQRADFFGRRSNNYTQASSWNETRYNAINNENTNTIEFRMFASGNAVWAGYCVEMVCYLINNAKHLNVDAVEAFVSSTKPH